METLRRIWQFILNLSADAPSPAESPDAPAPGATAQEAAQEAAGEIFAPRHSNQQQVHFTEVAPEDIVGKKAQDFFREGDGFREVHTETRVRTTPGIIVRPEAITIKCSHCGGFDCETHLCQCGRAVCRVCKRELIMPDGKAQTFCPEHFLIARSRWDSWQAYDQGRNK